MTVLCPDSPASIVLFLKDSFRLVGTEEFIAIKMHQMIRRIRNPDFCFPSNIRREFTESVARKERRNKNNIRRASGREPF